MEQLVLVLAALAAGAVVAAIAMRSRGTDSALSSLRTELRVLSERVGGETALISARLEGIDARVALSQDAGRTLATQVFETLGDVRRATETVAEQAREFTSLQDLLKPPKARGGLGEAMLEELLRQVLPPNAYEIQYRFSSGSVVDAVVKAGGRLVCIDSKFPLANFQRMSDAATDADRGAAQRAFAADVEGHIRAIATRYVVPDEGSLDFAVMYVPAEGVYGEVLRLSHRNRPLFDIAIESRVVPMSPLTLYGYLQTVLYGLRCLKVEESAQAVLDYCGRLGQEVERFAEEYDTLGRHLTNAAGRYDAGARRLERFRTSLEHVIDLEEGGDPPSLEAVGE